MREKQGRKSGGEYSPSPLILSLGGARKNKEKGYHRLQGEIAAHLLGARNDRKAGRLLVYPVCSVMGKVLFGPFRLSRLSRLSFFIPASLIFIPSAVKERFIDTGNCNKAYEKDDKHQCSVHYVNSFCPVSAIDDTR